MVFPPSSGCFGIALWDPVTQAVTLATVLTLSVTGATGQWMWVCGFSLAIWSRCGEQSMPLEEVLEMDADSEC